MWQYRAYVMDSVSSDQAIITSHRHSHILSLCTMHTLCTTPSQSCLLPFIPSLNSLFLIRRICNLLVCTCVSMGSREEVEIEMYKNWKKDLRYFSLVGVAFVSSEAQKPKRRETD